MRGRFATPGASMLLGVLFASSLPLALLAPAPTIVGVAGAVDPPTSSIAPLPPFIRNQVVEVVFSAQSSNEDWVDWTELYFRASGASAWTLYAAPWNTDGRWTGQTSGSFVEGIIPFDTFYTGGDGSYDLTTVAVSNGLREAGPLDPPKAATTVDTRIPQVFVASPTPDAWTNSKVLRWSATDAVSGLFIVEAFFEGPDPIPFEVVPGVKEASGSAELPLELAGDYSVSLHVVDCAANEVDVLVPFHYDPDAPSLVITAPEAGLYLNRARAEVRWSAADGASFIASFLLQVDAGVPVTLPPEASVHAVDSLSEGPHTATIIALDAAGNFASATVTFGVDITAPRVEITAPRADSYSSERDLAVFWAGTDALSGIRGYDVLVPEAGLAVSLPGMAATYTFPGVPQGTATIRVVAVDRAGNQAEASVRVLVDFTPPIVDITAPGRGSTVLGQLRVNWTASDPGSGVARVELEYDGAPPILVTGATTHRVAEPKVGPQFVLVRAWDRAGNVAEAVVPFTFSFAPGPGPSAIPSLEFWLLVALIGAGGIAIYVTVRRRHRS